ncbi:hypothetical protein K505DRAFT_361186 [Melanomma pulvis-pyrius CBS 109.77]|uniref:DUF1365-domain-containing protein n=1 Tax=Melanomma pulvis-pyrius CBS 109.77 TaxID=1314802 RepID=A0A6A6XEH7_9PLEO|nr:hypothetical protein K505DRAFT_361186 [Melanomma pulvis-pyrius CBS 109.77]
MPPYPKILAVYVIITFGLTACIYYTIRRVQTQTRTSIERSSHGVAIHKPQILRCKISHQRLFPEKNGFVYDYLAVGAPVRRAGGGNWFLSVDGDEERWWGRGWLRVVAGEHLRQGGGGGGRGRGQGNAETLEGRLDAFLRMEGLDPTRYPHVYLLTAPRFLGYKFSPASFWYLYNEEMRMEKVVAEVNNTFGERRMYIFTPIPSSLKPDPYAVLTFEHVAKDFHVSPFSSRKGAYVLETRDPAASGVVDVKVTLRSSKGRKKLVARWWSAEPAIDPETAGLVEVVEVLFGWVWMGLVTFPRIVVQAIVLAQVRKLSVWHRPEPRETAVPREPTSGEKELAGVFMRYMQHLLGPALGDVKISVCYGIELQDSKAFKQSGRDVHSPTASVRTSDSVLELRIHTPQFYRQLITYERLTGFLTYTLLHPWEENHTAWSNDTERLIASIRRLEVAKEQCPGSTCESSLFSGTMWFAYEHIRSTMRLQGAYPNPGLPRARAGDIVVDKADYGILLSKNTNQGYFLDNFVRSHCELNVQVRYILAVLGVQWRTKIMGVIGGE